MRRESRQECRTPTAKVCLTGRGCVSTIGSLPSDALVREMTTDIAKRVLAKPPGNPTRKAEQLPDDVLADIRQMLEATEPDRSSDEAEFYADAAMHLLNSTWGLEKSAKMMSDLGLDAQEFIRLVIGAMREIHEAQVA